MMAGATVEEAIGRVVFACSLVALGFHQACATWELDQTPDQTRPETLRKASQESLQGSRVTVGRVESVPFGVCVHSESTTSANYHTALKGGRIVPDTPPSTIANVRHERREDGVRGLVLLGAPPQLWVAPVGGITSIGMGVIRQLHDPENEALRQWSHERAGLALCGSRHARVVAGMDGGQWIGKGRSNFRIEDGTDPSCDGGAAFDLSKAPINIGSAAVASEYIGLQVSIAYRYRLNAVGGDVCTFTWDGQRWESSGVEMGGTW